MTDHKFELGKQNLSADEIAEIMSPALAEKKAQEKKHQQFIFDATNGELADNAGPYELRCIVERDAWYVPLKNDAEFEILNVRKGEHQALIARVSKKDGRRTVREGQGGQLLHIYQEKPNRPCAELDGRTLARSLPAKISGLLVQRGPEEPLRELYADHFNNLRGLADAVEIEDALMVDGPIETAKLLKYKFRVAIYNKGLWRKEHVVSVATFDDTQYFDDECTFEMMSGKDVFEKVLKDGSYGGIVVNPENDIGRNGQHIKGLLLSMNFIERALKSDFCELRVPAYVVRSH